jgi:hypothetical protein
MQNPTLGPKPEDDGPPPVLATWPRVYAFVVAYLVCLIGLFYLFTVHFAP